MRAASETAPAGDETDEIRLPLKRPPTYPRELMREVLEEHVKLAISVAARRMKVARRSLYKDPADKGFLPLLAPRARECPTLPSDGPNCHLQHLTPLKRGPGNALSATELLQIDDPVARFDLLRLHRANQLHYPQRKE